MQKLKDYLYLHSKDLLNMVNAMSESIYIKVTIRECLCTARLPRLDWSMGVFSVSIIDTTSIFQWLILLILEVLAAFTPVPFSGFIHFLCFASQSSDIVFVLVWSMLFVLCPSVSPLVNSVLLHFYPVAFLGLVPDIILASCVPILSSCFRKTNPSFGVLASLSLA